MQFIQSFQATPLKLQLRRDLVRTIKRGHAWVYADALRHTPNAAPGTPAILLDNRGGREIARGYYDPRGPIAFRICTTRRGETLNDTWVQKRMLAALALRRALFDPNTTGYRLFNGEGDGLPGLVCDIYGDHAALSLDGEAPEGFWNTAGIGDWLAEQLGLTCVYAQSRQNQGKVLVGELPQVAIPFLENGMRFTADIVQGQKTGFFLDQRDNRARIREIANEKRVLNVFGYTGGFSVAAGLGSAPHVTTVDLAEPAIQVASEHWRMNSLADEKHTALAADAFEYLADAAKQNRSWDLVILDPPSFAPSEQTVPGAINAYQKLIAAGAKVTQAGGILAAASCSSHVDLTTFLAVCEEGISQARRAARTLGVFGQPADHPAPLVMPEFRYLKFILLQLD
ncbi:MAG: class I SAM-dependent rRNA methyltransferase [Anaerolineales bacterium]|nr:class I SAM-dependent rRNA methyltransferase [Anaerolineales bacterium]